LFEVNELDFLQAWVAPGSDIAESPEPDVGTIVVYYSKFNAPRTDRGHEKPNIPAAIGLSSATNLRSELRNHKLNCRCAENCRATAQKSDNAVFASSVPAKSDNLGARTLARLTPMGR
jgi:hypothetical protein